MTGQKLKVNADLSIIGSTDLKKSLSYTNALSEEKLIRGMGVSLTFPPGFIPSTAWDKAAGGLGPDAPEKSPPAPSPAGCFTPPEPTSNPAVNSTGCRNSTKFHAAVKAGTGSNHGCDDHAQSHWQCRPLDLCLIYAWHSQADDIKWTDLSNAAISSQESCRSARYHI